LPICCATVPSYIAPGASVTPGAVEGLDFMYDPGGTLKLI
jgi:hypothetical protein